MNTHQNPTTIAAAFLAAQPTPPWREEDPITIYEIIPDSDPTDPQRHTCYLIAAGHDAGQVFQMAAQAPHRGTPLALILQAPGELHTTDAALDTPAHELPAGAIAAAGESPDAYGHRGTRILVATPAGLAGGMVVERANGERTEPICGTETPDPENPQHSHLVALLAARRTPEDVKRAAVDRIAAALADRLDGIDPADLDAENLPEDVAEIMRATAADALREIGMSALIDAVDPAARDRRPDALPENYDDVAAALLAQIEDDPTELDAPAPTPAEIEARRAALIEDMRAATADAAALADDMRAAAARITPGVDPEERASLLAQVETLRARHAEQRTRAEHLRREAVALGIDPTGGPTT